MMFDIDGTLIHSHDMDESCFLAAVLEVTGLELTPNWQTYPNVTDRGILKTFIKRQAPHWKLEELEPLVKAVFVKNIKQSLIQNPVIPVAGALEFIELLQADENIVVSFATGGWLETAKLKLDTAGFDINNLIIASSNDHFSRTEIMKIAALRATENAGLDFTYFGDASWDVNACNELNVNMVLVGRRTQHHQQIDDYLIPDHIFTLVT